jgi:hypothetical protein
MPCDSVRRPNETPQQRKEVVKKSLGRLEKALTEGRVKLKVGPNGAVAIDGWKADERDDVTDVCAIRTLQSQNSWAFRQALAKAETVAGRKMNQAAVSAGTHSHDGGSTWHPGHKK